MPGPTSIIATIASSEYFTISTGGSAYFYPKILNSNGASLSSESNADGNGSSFGHFYKNLLSTSSSLIVSNAITFCNTCNYPGDSTATVSLWTSTGKYLRVPLVGPTFTTIRRDMIAKEGIIINTVSTNSLYSTIVTYGPTNPSSFIFKEGYYSTIILADNTSSIKYSFSFADAVYLNFHIYGIDLTMSNMDANDTITVSGVDWYCNSSDHIVNTVMNGVTNYHITKPVWGDLTFVPWSSNNSLLTLNLCMYNLAPVISYRLSTLDELSTNNILVGTGIVTAKDCNFDCIHFPGTTTDYLSISTNIGTYTSGTICMLSHYESSSRINYQLFTLSNYASNGNAIDYTFKTGSTGTSTDSFSFCTVTTGILPTYSQSNWHFLTITFSNYTKNKINYFDFYSYYDTILQYSNLSNVGHTSSLMGNQLVVGCNYPGNLMNLSIFDRSLCKREMELYLDIVNTISNSTGMCTGIGTGTGTGTGGGGGSSNYYYTGSTQSFAVPSGVTNITITMSGGAGSDDGYGGSGGNGGLVVGILSVSYGQSYQIIVGAGGDNGGSSVRQNQYAGGGAGSLYWIPGGGGNGGGYSAVADMTSVVIAIAGAGGGAAYGASGGSGGGTTGGNGYNNSPNYGNTTPTKGGTQSGGGDGSGFSGPSYPGAYPYQGYNGAFLQGGDSGYFYGGGGGGGYYGGGGGGFYTFSGAGGSSYVDGLTSVTTNTNGGGSSHGSDGYVTITW